MTKKPRDRTADDAGRQPALEDGPAALDGTALKTEDHLRRAEAALRGGEPEDRRDIARQTTPAGKGRSK